MPETLEEKRRPSVDVIRRVAMANAARQENEPRRTLRTVAAARYLGLSASLLRKYRAMGRDDPGVHGPAFIKISANVVLYEVSALDDWLDARRSAAAELPR
jgi:hypothetical protein